MVLSKGLESACSRPRGIGPLGPLPDSMNSPDISQLSGMEAFKGLCLMQKGTLFMRLQVRSRKIKVTDEVNNLIADRFSRALARFEDRVRDISVLITDINGPKGGADKLLRIRVLLSGCERVLLTSFGSNLSLMINSSAGRLKERVSSSIAKARHFDARQRICKELVV